MTTRIHLSFLAGLFVLSACAAAFAPPTEAVKRGQLIYNKECAQCHGPAGAGAGPASLGLGGPAPQINTLKQDNDGYFPREFVRRFVMGLLETEDPNAAMPDFATQGLRHVYPEGGADGEVLETDFEALLDYLASVQL